jgi:hypothetical protein
MKIEGLTISEMIEETGLRRNTIEVRLHRLGIRPITTEVLYPPDTLERIKASKRGRPPKKQDEQ